MRLFCLGLFLTTVIGACGRIDFRARPGDASGSTTDAVDAYMGNGLVLGALAVSNVTTTSFDATIAFQGDSNDNATAMLLRCDDTKSLGCSPLAGTQLQMVKSSGAPGGTFTASVTATTGEDPGDTLNLAVVAADPDGVAGSPAMAAVTLASSATCTPGMQTFAFTGAAASFVVPSGCTTIVVKAWGAGGGGSGGDTGDVGQNGGGAGFARTTLTVTPGESLTIDVGGGGGGGAFSPSMYASAGGGGGDLSGVQRGATWLIVAGGGGGAAGNLGGGAPASGVGGGAAGTAGGTDSNQSLAGGGGGGTATMGGAAGSAGTNGVAGAAGSMAHGGAGGSGAGSGGGVAGALGFGGAGGAQGAGGNHAGGGGGGGGGFYGGGGGGSGAGGNGTPSGAGGGGGGGSGYTSGTLSALIAGSGTAAGNNADPFYVAGTGVGGARGTQTMNGANGGNGFVVISY